MADVHAAKHNRVIGWDEVIGHLLKPIVARSTLAFPLSGLFTGF